MGTARTNKCEIFNLAAEIADGEERLSYIAEACGDDLALRKEIEELLEHDGLDDTLLDKSAPGLCPTLDQVLSEQPGIPIGPYKLLEPIGEGGFGVVYLAEQTQPVRRKVALKILKPGMDTRQVIARFEAERQALALMDHPHIAKVFDGGTTAPASGYPGRPYFVMELVKGVPITEFCENQNQLTPRERLELFIPVCQAVQHAHQKGIIHRDLKPANVLVTVHDTRPVAKVIDFGVAKALGQELTEKTLFTGIAQMVGTPLYMSPEQAGQDSLDVDTRSDVYSLGVLLYELLTGTTPLGKERFKQSAYDEIRRIIREEEPPRPSSRLSELSRLGSVQPSDGHDGHSSLNSVSTVRRMEPNKLQRLLRGELDWIVMKALEKDRSRRYETANGLALDLRRYLADEPVQASPPSTWYRFYKFSRRNKSALAMGSVVAVALLASVVSLAVSNWQIAAALREAQAEKRQRMEQLWRALLSESQATQLTPREGQRIKTLEIVKEATDLARTLELPDANIRELRNTAIGALSYPDTLLSGPGYPSPVDALSLDLDDALSLYARTDRQGNCSVRRITDDVEIHSMPGLGGGALPYLSRDGKFLAVSHFAVDRMAVQLWDLRQARARLIWSEANARWVDFHPNSHQIALAYNDGAIGLFELPSGRRLSRWAHDTLTREVTIALHPTEPLVAVCSYFEPVVQIRDLGTGDVVASLEQNSLPNSVAWDPDGRTLAVGMAEAQQITLYDRKTLQSFRTIKCEQETSYVTFNHLGDRLASFGWGKFLQVFDVGTGQKLTSVSAALCRFHFSDDDRRLAGAIEAGKLGIWLVADGRECRMLAAHRNTAERSWTGVVSVSPDGRLLVAGMLGGFGVWDLVNGGELDFIPTDDQTHTYTLFEPSGDLLVMCPNGLFRWPIGKTSPEQWVMGPPQRLPLPRGNSLGQSRDGRVIVTSAWMHLDPGAGGRIFHTDRSDSPIPVHAGADVDCIAVSPDGRWVITVTHIPDGMATVWDARDGTQVKKLCEWGSGAFEFSPDGRWLSTGLDGGRLFAVGGDWEPGPRVGGVGTFAPDSKLLAVADRTGGKMCLVNPDTGQELAVLENPNLTTTSAPIFTPDGTKLVALNLGRLNKLRDIRVWDLRLIRQQLAKMGLDWDAPPYPAADPEAKVIPLRLEVRRGDPTELESTGETNR